MDLNREEIDDKNSTREKEGRPQKMLSKILKNLPIAGGHIPDDIFLSTFTIL
jgi:hypothetical protein